ncbi:MAG: LPS export ABC transporter periplasmic protein LptC [Syntrophobacteria bacterium]
MEQRFWNRIPLIRWTLCLSMLAAVLVLFAGVKVPPGEDRRSSISFEASEEEGRLTLNNFDYCDVREGRARWTLNAAKARYFDDRQETVLSEIRAVIFLRDGREVELQARDGVFHNDSKNIEVSGNVRVNYGGMYLLVTDHLAYDHDRDVIYTSAPVSGHGQGITLKGQGMELKIHECTLSILEGVETKVQGLCLSEGSPRGTSRGPA